MILGIDGGKKGCFALLHENGAIVALHKMPLNSAGKVDFQGIWKILEGMHALTRIGIEKLLSFPSDCAADKRVDGRIGTLTMGINWGVIIGMIEALRIPYEVISPRTWQAVMCKTELALPAKAKAEIAAKRLWPMQDWRIEGCRKPHDGAIDAALIAEYTRMRYLGGTI